MSQSPQRRGPFGRRLASWAAAAAVLTASTVASAAPPPPDDEEPVDARLQSYETPVHISGGTMGTYMLLGLVGLLAVGVTFKNARRSHLD